MNLKINLRLWWWVVIIYFFAFQRVLVNIWYPFSYFDEIFTIYSILIIFLNMFNLKAKLNKSEKNILLLFFILIIIGILGNFIFSILDNNFYIFIDIISTIKVWFAYYAVILISNNKKEFWDLLIIKLAKIARIIVIIMFIYFLKSRFVETDMNGNLRYGIKSFKFVFNVPGNFSKFFYFLIPLLTADLYYKNTLYKKIIIGVSLIIWCFTLRSRAIAFAVTYLIISIIFFSKGKIASIKSKFNIKMRYILFLLLIMLPICWNQIIFYFTSSTQARAVLLRYSIVTLERFFPLGAGFGTFGSDVAIKNYSKLYIEYGFDSYYGMGTGEEGMFLNDNYWPMIFGQFGFFGTVLIISILVRFMKMVFKITNNNKYFYFASFCALGFLLLSSVASKSYSEFSSICVFLLVGILVKSQRLYEIESSIKKLE